MRYLLSVVVSVGLMGCGIFEDDPYKSILQDNTAEFEAQQQIRDARGFVSSADIGLSNVITDIDNMIELQWFGQFFDEKVPFSEIGIMDNQVNDTPHTERRH